MDIDRAMLSRIKDLLKNNPRGLNVKEIAKAIDMNRVSVARYLEMLVISGHIDVKAFGPSKVYYISQRLPVSAMISLSSDFILIIDKDRRIMNVNDRFIEFLEIAREEILHNKIETLAFALDFEPPILPNVTDALNGKESMVEAFLNEKDRDWFFNIKFIPIVFDDGRQGATVIFEDITDRKLVELAIRESEHKLRSIVEQALDGFVLTDEQGMITEFNRGEELITGIKREDAIGQPIWDVQMRMALEEHRTAGTLARARSVAEEILKTGKATAAYKYYEKEIERPDGTRRTTQATTFPIKTEKGYILCGIVHDITERKQIETAVRESEQKLRSLIEQSLDGIILTDEQGLVTEYNYGEEQITGIKKDDVIGKPVWEVQYASALPERRTHALLQAIRSATQKYLETGIPPSSHANVDTEIERPDGTRRTIRVTTFHIKTEKGYRLCGITHDITDRKQIETAIRESERKLRSVIEQSLDGIIITDEGGRIIQFNRGMESAIGIKSEEALGEYVWDILYRVIPQGSRIPKVFDTFKAAHETLLKDGRVIPGYEYFEKEIERPDGTRRMVQILPSPIRTDKGFMICLITRDVTRDRQISDALKESEAKYRQLVENASSIILQMDAGGRITFFNKYAQRFFGYTEEEVLGESAIGTIIPATDSAGRETAPMLRDLLEDPDKYQEHENENVRRGGERAWIMWTNRAIRDKGGKTIGLMSIGTDVTKKREAEERIRESEANLRVLVDMSPAALFIYQGEDIIMLNSAAEKLMGYGRDDLLRMRFWDIVHPDDRGLVQERGLARQRGEAVPSRYEVRIVARNGDEKWVELVAGTIEHKGKTAVIMSLYDITGRKAAEAALNKRLWFENLVTMLSSKFINLAPEEIDGEINLALRRIGEFSGVDRCFIYQSGDNGLTIDETHVWCAEGVESVQHMSTGVRVEDAYPGLTKVMLDTPLVHIPSVEDLPPAMARDRATLAAMKIKSVLMVPMPYKKTIIGLLGFVTVREKKTWTEDDIALLKIVGEILANALRHKQAEEALIKSNAILARAQSIAHVGHFAYDLRARRFRLSDESFRIFGYVPREMEPGVEQLEAHIHAEDRALLKRSVEAILHDNKLFDIDLRIRRPDGTTRYVNCIADQLKRDAAGNPRFIYGIVQDITERRKA